MALYRDGEGRQRSAGTYATKTAAKNAAKLAEAGIMPVKTEVAYPGKIRGKLTVAGYAPGWLANHPMAPHTAYVYDQMVRKHIVPALGGRVLADVAVSDVRAMFRRYEADGTSKALLAKIKTVLSAMMQAAAEDGLVPVNVVRGVRFQAAPPKRRRALTADQWLRVRKYLTGEYRLLGDVVMATGCRIEEALGMEGRDITNGVWHIQRVRNQVDGEFTTKDKTKNGRTRRVTLPAGLAGQIKAAGPGRVFTDFRLDSYRQLHWYPACKAAGLDWRPAPRDLRRTFATMARAKGVDLEVIRKVLGHGDLDTTRIYLDEKDEAPADAMEAVEKALKDAA